MGLFPLGFLIYSAFAALSFNLHAEPTHFLLVRHGETDWNREKRFQGQTDIPLNSTGMAQADSLAEELIKTHPDVSAIYSSDLSRAYATALQSAEKYHLPVIKTQNLREICWGELEGVLSQEKIALAAKDREERLQRDFPDRKERWNYPIANGVESYNALVSRVKKQLSEIAKEHPGEKVLIFTHGRVIRTLIIEAQNDESGLDSLGNCSVVHIVFDPEKTGKEFCVKQF